MHMHKWGCDGQQKAENRGAHKQKVRKRKDPFRGYGTQTSPSKMILGCEKKNEPGLAEWRCQLRGGGRVDDSMRVAAQLLSFLSDSGVLIYPPPRWMLVVLVPSRESGRWTICCLHHGSLLDGFHFC